MHEHVLVEMNNIFDSAQSQDEYDVLNKLVSRYESADIETKKKMELAFLVWLTDSNLVKVDYAIRLIVKFKVTNAIPQLKQLLSSIDSGASQIPRYFNQMVNNAISELT